MANISSPKRRKIEARGCSTDTVSPSQEEISLIPVLPNHVTASISLVPVYAAPIQDKRKTSELLRRLSVIYPLDGLSHIKRVRKQTTGDGENGKGGLDIVLCETTKVAVIPGNSPVEASLGDILTEAQDIGSDVLGEPFVAMVPKTPPQTRQQFREANCHWPTAFHEDKELALLMSGKLFSEADKEIIKRRIKEIACTEETSGQHTQERLITAVVVDPKTDVTVAKSEDRVAGRGNPLQHAVMKVIDLVAHSQGGGAWPVDPADSYHPDGSHGRGSEDLQYLCTGYDLYVSQEPCIMCAMALVHSRIRRVFYHASHADGALGSRYKLHTEPDINHRFQVFRVTFGDHEARHSPGTLHPS